MLGAVLWPCGSKTAAPKKGTNGIVLMLIVVKGAIRTIQAVEIAVLIKPGASVFFVRAQRGRDSIVNKSVAGRTRDASGVGSGARRMERIVTVLVRTVGGITWGGRGQTTAIVLERKRSEHGDEHRFVCPGQD